MEYKMCPLCGSKYFVSSKSGKRVVFHIKGDTVHLIPDQGPDALESAIDPEKIHCAACSWSGAMSDLAR